MLFTLSFFMFKIQSHIRHLYNGYAEQDIV